MLWKEFFEVLCSSLSKRGEKASTAVPGATPTFVTSPKMFMPPLNAD